MASKRGPGARLSALVLSVNAMLAEALRRYADDTRPGDVFSAIEALADAHAVGSESGERSWTRDDLQRS